MELAGDGTNEYNTNGTIENSDDSAELVLLDQTIDTSGFTVTNTTTDGNTGYGTIVTTGTITLNGSTLEVKQTYFLGETTSFMKAKTQIKNTSGSTISNIRLWVGTRDDYVNGVDILNKQKGNIVDGSFQAITNQTDRAQAIKVYTASEGLLFYSTSDKANTAIAAYGSFENIVNTDPASSEMTKTNDGSYGLFVRFSDLADQASEEITWYYAAGEIDQLDAIVDTVSESADNSIPTVSDESISVTAGETYSGTLTASDADNDALTYSIVTNGSHGTATITDSSTGAFTYIPDDDASGDDSFTFKVNDSIDDSSIGTISVTISSGATAPEFISDYPRAAGIIGTGFQLRVQLDQPGDVYYVVLADGSEEPSVSEIKAGTATEGAAALAWGNIPVDNANADASADINLLSSGTPYDVYLVAQNNNSPPDVQTSATQLEVTTTSENPPDAVVLLSPENNTTIQGDAATFTWNPTTDPDGDEVSYKLYVCQDSTFVDCDGLDVSASLFSMSAFSKDGFLSLHRSVFTPNKLIAAPDRSLPGTDIDYLYTFIAGVVFLLLIISAYFMRNRKAVMVVLTLVLLTAIGIAGCQSEDDSSTSVSTKTESVSSASSGLEAGVYYWRVIASDPDGNSTSSETWSFTVE